MRRVASLLAVLVLTAACGEKDAKEAAPPPKVENHSSVVFTPGSPQIAQIISAPVEPRNEMTLRFNGRLIWNEDRTARVFAPFAGRVTKIEVRPGDRVKEKQALAILASPELGTAQAEARKAEQDYGFAQKNMARIKELFDAGVTPAKDLQAAQADLARAASERARSQAKLSLYGKEDTADQELALRTPIAGVVVERNLNPGQELRPDNQGDKPLFVVSDPTQLWFLLDVAEKDIGIVKAGSEVRIIATSLGDERVMGRVQHVADVVDPQTRTVKIRGRIDRTDPRLKAEMFVVAEMRVAAPGGLLVPARAIYLRGEQNFVFIDEGNGRYTRRAVITGPANDGLQTILSGLAATDRVVVDGNLLLERLLAAQD
jgi:cobalt-zinc-cadmium efflux system membrane fusion protein